MLRLVGLLGFPMARRLVAMNQHLDNVFCRRLSCKSKSIENLSPGIVDYRSPQKKLGILYPLLKLLM